MTKKEIKEQEKKQQELHNLRESVIYAIKSYWKDIDATTRYYKINNMNDKLDYRGNLQQKEKQELLNRYEILEFIKAKYCEKEQDNSYMWTFCRQMVNTFENMYKCLHITNDYISDTLWNNEIIWDEQQAVIYLTLAKKFGYKYLITTDSSTALMHELHDFITHGAVVIDTCTIKNRTDSFGLVLDISNVKYI